MTVYHTVLQLCMVNDCDLMGGHTWRVKYIAMRKKKKIRLYLAESVHTISL